MIKKIIEHVSQNNSSNARLFEMIKVIKAKSTNGDIIKSLGEMETSIAISINRSKKILDTLKDGLESYSQQFASEFNIVYEIVGNEFLFFNKVKGGYQLLITNNNGDTIVSKTFIKQIEGMKFFIELYKTK